MNENNNKLYVLIIDISNSVTPYKNLLNTFINTIFKLSNQYDYICVYNYSGKCSKLCSPILKKNFDKNKCISNLKGALYKKGATGLYNAINYVINDIYNINLKNINTINTIVLSEGYDNINTYDYDKTHNIIKTFINKNNFTNYYNYFNMITYGELYKNIFNLKYFKYINNSKELTDYLY